MQLTQRNLFQVVRAAFGVEAVKRQSSDLIYRGISYSASTQPKATIKAEWQGCYRGVSLGIISSAIATTAIRAVPMTYRGTTYLALR